MRAKPYSQACENNKKPILAVLQQVFANARTVVEFGSGTGQHAAYFAAEMPWLVWQPTDRQENLAGIAAWREEVSLPNLREPLELDVDQPRWPVDGADAVFSANTCHIMSWPQVERLVAGVGNILAHDGFFCLYGPFNYAGQYTSASNADFDAMLRARDPASGLRGIEAMHRLTAAAGLEPEADHAMPANNRLLVWRKRGPVGQR